MLVSSPETVVLPLRRLAAFVLRHPRSVLGLWLVALIASAPFALRLGSVAQGGSEAIRGSEAHAAMVAVDRAFGRGFAHLIPVVLMHEVTRVEDPAFARVVGELAQSLMQQPGVRGVLHPWNVGIPGLIGRDGKSVLLLVQPDVDTLAAAEGFTGPLRKMLRPERLPAGFTALVTGMSSTYHDLNHRSAADLLHAEMVGVPLTLLVLFLVFRTAVAALLALAVAASAVMLSSAVLYAASPWLPVSVLAQNVITMIGLGAGTDYALFLLHHHGHARGRGLTPDETILYALSRAVPAIVMAGLAVAGGFAALFLVNARFLHSLALGGVAVVAAALAATLTLLPALLHFAGDRVHARPAIAPAPDTASGGRWVRWANFVMGRPGTFLTLALVLSAAFAWPAAQTKTWTIGPRDLPPDTEARAGFAVLETQFQPGWMGPVVITVESPATHGVWTPASQRAILALTTELERDPRVAEVLGFPRLLAALPAPSLDVSATAQLPAALASASRIAVSEDGRTALILLMLRESPADRSSIELVGALRSRVWVDAEAAGLRLKIGGGSALIRDFNSEMLSSVGRVMAVVLTLTFILLLAYFRSIVVPLKAIVANLLSVFAAYGFLVLVFQYGCGAGLLGITPPGGLNSFVVLMLFTILFGLSMDYEIFLLSAIRDEFASSHDNARAVATGLAGTARVITSAAAIMVCLFGSFGFFGLTASRQFGLGLAFAVAFDATVVRLLIVPATMRLLGAWNWWLPRFGRPIFAAGTVEKSGL